MTRPRSSRPSAVPARARLLRSLRDGDVICISGGKAVYEVVNATEPKARYDVVVVPATGGVQGRYHTDVNYLASELAARLGGRAYQLHAPIFVDTPEEKQALLNVRQIREVLERARQADIAVVGVGGVIPGTSSFFDLLSASDADRDRIIANRAARGELFGHVFDEDGAPVRAGALEPARRRRHRRRPPRARSASGSRPAARRWHPSAASCAAATSRRWSPTSPPRSSLLDAQTTLDGKG